MICLFFSITLLGFFLNFFRDGDCILFEEDKICSYCSPLLSDLSVSCLFCAPRHDFVFLFPICFLSSLYFEDLFPALGEFFPLLLLLPPVTPYDFVTSRFTVLCDEL